METVFDALKAMGKATSVELAARLDISREEVLNELWELKRNGVVDKTGHTWFLAGEGESRVNADERHVMIPKENGSWLYLIDLEHALRVAGIRIKGEEHGNKTRG
ncbi:hypothetical protein FD543_04200 [Escherichia coli]|nr:hypothetical protein [Escherichia coli]